MISTIVLPSVTRQGEIHLPIINSKYWIQFRRLDRMMILIICSLLSMTPQDEILCDLFRRSNISFLLLRSRQMMFSTMLTKRRNVLYNYLMKHKIIFIFENICLFTPDQSQNVNIAVVKFIVAMPSFEI